MDNRKSLSSYSKYLWSTLALSGVCCLVSLLLRPIADPDFFWHLKTGEWIIQHHALPSTDPFTINPPAIPEPHQKFILTSYWLYQVIISCTFNMMGFTGIIFIRFLLAGIMIFLVYRHFRLENTLSLSICILSAILFLKEYTLDRPQTISFVMFMVLLLMLYRLIDNKAEGLSLLRYSAWTAILMLAWSNMHGGYLVGQLILLLVVATEGIKFLHHSLRPTTRSGYFGLVCVVSAALVCSFINPNHINGIKQIFSVISLNSFASSITTEYISVLKKWQNTGSSIIFIYYFIAAVAAAVAVLSYRRADITKLAILVSTGYFGFMHIRYFPFFLIAAILFICRWLETGKTARIVSSAVILVTISSIFLCFAYGTVIPVTANTTKWVSDDDFPVSVADFLTERHAQGGIFSHYKWGGYLIWRLAPGMKLFIDSRNMDFKRLYEYSYCEELIESSMGDGNTCKRLFEDYGINYVIINTIDLSGTAHPLLYSIGEAHDWELIYFKDDIAVFQRKLI